VWVEAKGMRTETKTKPHIASRLALSLAALTGALLVAGLVFMSTHPVSGGDLVDLVILVLFLSLFPTLGALIGSRRPRNPIGWIFCGMGLLFVLTLLTGAYAEYGLSVEPGSLPGAEYAGWFMIWVWPILLCPIGFVLLLFPDGHPPTPRWRWIVWLLAGAHVGWILGQSFGAATLANADLEGIRNPFALEALGPAFRFLAGMSIVFLLIGVLTSIVAIVVRFRRSRGDERRQLKWLAYAGCVVAIAAAISVPTEGLVDEDSTIVRIAQLSLFISLAGVPIAAGIAILKYRLYDIDVIINRTLVYASLTVVLAVVYAAGVVGLGSALRSITGQENNSLAVAASTLAVAALFRPARARFQSLIDRRFYRRKYDAAKTLEAFGARLRDEVELDALTADLLSTVKETMQPSYASIWLRASGTAQ
jgi:hypothetical protein